MFGLSTQKERQRLHFLQDFEAPVRNVFSFYSDHNRLNEIYPAFIKRIIDSPNPTNCNDVGSARLIIGFPIFFTETITKYVENKYIEYAISYGSPIKNHIGKMQFIELSPNKTRLDYIIEFEPRIPYTGFFIHQINAKLVQESLSKLALRFRHNPNY
ncbi:MAG: SRPBCC family protein [Chitinophagales bacterium]